MKRLIKNSVTSSNNENTKYARSFESSDLKETAYAIANYMSNIDGIVNDNTKRVTIRKSGDGYNIYIGYRFGALLGEYGGKSERNLTILEEKGYDREDVLTDRGKTLLQFFESVRQDLMNIHPDVDIRISPVRKGMHGLYGLGISADLVVNVTSKNDSRLSTIDASVTFSNFVLDRKGELHSTSDLLKGYSITRDTSFICPKDEYSLVEIYSDADGQHVLQCTHCQTQYAYEDDDLESFQEI